MNLTAREKRRIAELELREEYNEQAWEMRVNDIRPPNFREWKKARKVRR